MNILAKYNWTAGLVAALLCLPLTVSADTTLHGRISYDAGGTLIKGLEESDWSSGTVNTLILPGDTVWVDNGGSSELEFSGGTFLRMADGSKVEIVDLPPNGTTRGWIGSFYVQRLSRSTGDFTFYTPAGTVAIEKDSSVRIDIVSEGITTISTRWGRATIRTDAGGSVTAHAGKRVFVETGLLPSHPSPFDRSTEDGFDSWNRERAAFLATGSTQTPASVPISQDTLGVSDLDRYGEWVYVDDTPYWRPTAVVDYTPYRYGYWNNVHNVGNVWVGNYPFSYITSHHGYWDYNDGYGWLWSYTPQWSPAWAATVRYGDYFVWSPVNSHYYPVYPTSSAYFNIGGVSFGYWGSSYVPVNSLYSGPGYVNYAYNDTFRNYYGHGNTTVNIWNINSNSRRPQVRVPYNNSVTTVRNYTPRRSIRGASTLQVSGRTATARVQRLESSRGRSTYTRATRTGANFVRTASARPNDTSRLRTARINQSTPDYARATRGNPVRATSARPQRNNVATLTNTRSGRSTRGTTTSREATTVRRTQVDRSATTRGGTRTTTKPQRTDIDPRSDSFNARTPITSYRRTPARTSSSGRTTTTTRTPSRNAAPATRTGSTGIRTASRDHSMANSTRSPRRTAIPQTRQAPARARTQTSHTPRVTQSTRSSAPTRTASSHQNTRQTRRSTPTRSVAPRQSTHQQYTAPRRSVAPRQSTHQQYSAPTRSVAPRQQRSVAPSRNRAPSGRSMTTRPSRQTSVRSGASSHASSRSSMGRSSVSRGSSHAGRSHGGSRGR